MRLSGTSMAAGVVSGTLALVIEARRTAFAGAPPLTPNAAKALLQFTALKVHDELGAEYDALTQGAGWSTPPARSTSHRRSTRRPQCRRGG